MHQPVLYLSEFFERNKSHYYENLTRVRLHNDIQQWFKFFLVGTIEMAIKGVEGLRKILALKKDIQQNRLSVLGSTNAMTLLNALFVKPIVSVDDVALAIGKSNVTSYKLIAEFERLGILTKKTDNQRNPYYVFQEYFKIFE